MKCRLTTRLALPLFAIAAATSAHGQMTTATATIPHILVSFMDHGLADGQLLRVIDDPSLGTRWLLMRDPTGRGGPGRLVLAAMMRTAERREEPAFASHRPMIHAGDWLIVSESTPVIEARFEAIALSPAMIGSSLNVRLKIGGVVLRAVAMAPGQAAIQQGNGASR